MEQNKLNAILFIYKVICNTNFNLKFNYDKYLLLNKYHERTK